MPWAKLLVAVPCWARAMMLQQRSREGSVFASHDSSAIRYTGRFEPDERGRPQFDVNGFQIQFRVKGASEVSVELAQTLSGPFGWYTDVSEGTEKWRKRQEQLGLLVQNVVTSPSLLQEDTTILSQEGVFTTARMEDPGSQPHEFLVYVDGQPQMKPTRPSDCWGCTFDTVRARNGTSERYLIVSGLSPGEHEIGIFKASDPEWSSREPTPNWLTFYGVHLDRGEVLPPKDERPKRRLEFFGDSSMSGYCNLCSNPLISPERQGSFAVAWPTLLCDALGAECHSATWAGYGVHQNCCGNDKVRMPQLWRRAVLTDSRSRWRMRDWIPDAVVLNLGTNDHIGMSDGAKPQDFRDDYLELVQSIVDEYGEDVHLFLACGPMGASRPSCPHVKTVVEDASGSGLNVHYLDHQGFLNGTFGPPCCGHPSVQNGFAMARVAQDLIEQKLGWHKQ